MSEIWALQCGCVLIFGNKTEGLAGHAMGWFLALLGWELLSTWAEMAWLAELNAP
jgi:hypothetical protein